MATEMQQNTLGPLLNVDGWVEALRTRVALNYHCQNGQYVDDQKQPLSSQSDPGSVSQDNDAYVSAHECTDSMGSNSQSDSITGGSKSCKDDHHDSATMACIPALDSGSDALTTSSENSESLKRGSEVLTSQSQDSIGTEGSYYYTPNDGNTLLSVKTYSKRKKKEPVKNDCTEFAMEFFGSVDNFHRHYHWNQIDRNILSYARDRGLEPTTLGHVLSRRRRLWAQTQCIDNTARVDFENHIRLYQKQFEAYSKSGDGWVSVNCDHKVDELFLKEGTYLKGAEKVQKVMRNAASETADKEDDLYDEVQQKRGPKSRNKAVEGIYNWHNVIYCPSFEDTGEFVRRYARKSTLMYKNLYDCLVHGWVHPGLVVCKVKDATHPIRFSTPPDQDCYTVLYAGPRIPENSTQRVIFGEYTGIVYREESVEESVFEYAFELNFSSAAWISADVELTKDTAEITENNGVVLLPNNARFVLDSSNACNELSLVNHYQSVKAYAGEMWVTPNCEWQQVFLDGWPHVVLTSKIGVAINPGDELVADFGGLWFSKVEETAHKQIRNELIEYRLGLRKPAMAAEQLLVPKRPLSTIDVGLTSNSCSNAYAICGICYNCNEEQAGATADMADSVSCDGCDRFFHVHCVTALSKASAVYVSRDLLGENWGPLEKGKNIIGGSGVFYCSFCRHLAKKIYTHDMGCDYMPLTRGAGRSQANSKFIGSYKPNEATRVNNVTTTHVGMAMDAKDIGEPSCDLAIEMDVQMDIEDDCTVNISSGKENNPSPANRLALMKAWNQPSLFELEVAKQKERLARDGICLSSNDGADRDEPGEGTLQSDGRQSSEEQTQKSSDLNVSTSLSDDSKRSYCSRCLKEYSYTTPESSARSTTNHSWCKLGVPYIGDFITSSGIISARDSQQNRGGGENGDAGTPPPGKGVKTVGKHSKNKDMHPSKNSNEGNEATKAATVTKGRRSVGFSLVSDSLSTAIIGHAVDRFINKEKHPYLKPRFLPPDPLNMLNKSNETTMVDYLSCKYLAGMWQVEPFAVFGDCVRVCTECYKNNGPKANVYVCRILKRHLAGNFDHPMNTTPTQMRELVLMAYEQHIQMLLRLLVLKNVSIIFMCKLCCHFIGRQLLQNKSVIPPLPFSREFMGKSAGTSEGLLNTPSDLINPDYCKSKKIKKEHETALQSHLASFVTSVKNAVSSVPVSSKSTPTLNYELLNSMGALSDEFSRLANCDGIIDYLNDLMSHKVLDTETTPSQLPETLTKEELKRFSIFRHLSERPAGVFVSTANSGPSKIKMKGKTESFIPLLGVMPGVSYFYRKFTDGYYNGLITKYLEDSSGYKSSFLVTYSDGDDERMTQADLLAQVLSNLENMNVIVPQLSRNDSRNQSLLIEISDRKDGKMAHIVETAKRNMLKSLMLLRAPETKKGNKTNNATSEGAGKKRVYKKRKRASAV